VPLFKGPTWEGAKGPLVIIPKVVISLLMVSRGIIIFEKHIAAVGTTSKIMFSKRLLVCPKDFKELFGPSPLGIVQLFL